ncbi:cytochrome P450 [Sinomicrobium weinanense]|uniref:Cytochrome P450 n=1 Tax=Sinomicrobium weinanense TaxID=2842200 RepID=A0A926JNE7_9FLAO|nr:cytochrome P450 [Sinomicrobium weinanense]MBC9794416.1 cytochrome P450 [Sinomicrobium weinanense]MBU3124323.1 cytochrome P450 [Sinomicrobium weinanense]
MNTVFSPSEITDPFRVYAAMREECPIYRDTENNIWAVYGYRDCEFFLKNELAEIPGTHAEPEVPLNKYTRIIRENLVRRSNPPEQRELKESAMQLVRMMQPVKVSGILDELLKEAGIKRLDWTETVAKVLPVTVLLKSLLFREDDIAFILLHIPLIKMYMGNPQGQEEVKRLNAFSEKVYPLVKAHFRRVFPAMFFGEAHVSNLIGLCIQSYDAMRGLLGNSLLQYLYRKNAIQEKQGDYFRKLVIETLRFDPVFHNTRRILTEDVERGGRCLKKGEELLLVLASANRDASVFDRADTFDINRENNGEYLSFSSGMHRCPADHFSINLAKDTLEYIASRYKNIKLLKQRITYASMTNAKIPENIILKLSE